MIETRCPKCQDPVLLPARLESTARLRCPLCREEYRAAEISRSLPPALIVLDGAGSAAADEEDGGDNEELGQLQIIAEDQAARPAPPGSQPFQFAADRTAGSSAVAPLRARRSSGRNPAIEFAKIALGGLLAIPLAQLILWWLPASWSNDPVGMGPKVARVVPWVVPARYRGDAAEGFAGSDASGDLQEASSRSRQRPIQRPMLTGPPELGPQPDPPDEAVRNFQPGPPPDLVPPPQADPSTNTSPLTPFGDAAPGSQGQSGSNEVATANSTPRYTARDLGNAYAAVNQLDQAWNDQPEGARGDQLYEELSRLAEFITYIDTSDPQTPARAKVVGDLLKQYAEQPAKLEYIAQHAAEALSEADRPREGVVLYGQVREIGSRGLLHATQLVLATRTHQEVTVVSSVNPNQRYETGDRVLILGVVVNDPAANLVQYEGEEPQVVVGGYPVVIKQAGNEPAAAPDTRDEPVSEDEPADAGAPKTDATTPNADTEPPGEKTDAEQADADRSDAASAGSDNADGGSAEPDEV